LQQANDLEGQSSFTFSHAKTLRKSKHKTVKRKQNQSAQEMIKI